MKDFRSLMESVAARSLWSLPLHDAEGQVIGTFALYGRYCASPSKEQWRLAHHLADLAGLIIARPF